MLAVDGARDDPDELFDRAHSAEQIGDIVEAEKLYRLLMKRDPTDASAPFNLGNMLRAAARTVEAEAALRAATRANPAFAEAWYNLADLLDDQGRSQAAIECMRKHPTTLMQRSISRCCCNGTARLPKPQTIGGGIWRTTVAPNGRCGLGGR